jgi:hypothetical protein
MWVWIAVGVGGVLLLRTFTGKSAPASSSSNITANGSNANVVPPNIFYLPDSAQGGSLGSGGGSASVIMNRNPGNGGSTGVSGIFQGANPPRGTFRATAPQPNYVHQNVAGIASAFGTTVDALSPLDFGA